MKSFFKIIIVTVTLCWITGVALAESMNGNWTITHCGGTYDMSFSDNSKGGFSGRYINICNSSNFNGNYYAGRGMTIVNFVQKHDGKDYYAVYVGFLSGNKVDGVFYDIANYKCNFTMTKK